MIFPFSPRSLPLVLVVMHSIIPATAHQLYSFNPIIHGQRNATYCRPSTRLARIRTSPYINFWPSQHKCLVSVVSYRSTHYSHIDRSTRVAHRFDNRSPKSISCRPSPIVPNYRLSHHILLCPHWRSTVYAVPPYSVLHRGLLTPKVIFSLTQVVLELIIL
jgi:hypothetical protein